MKIGLFTDGLPDLDFPTALDWVVEHDIEAVEFSTGGFSNTPHCNSQEMLSSQDARSAFMEAISSRGLTLSALNCNANLLDPHPERRKLMQDGLRDTIELANLLGLDTVVTMSGCPGGPDGGTYPNWVTHPWQPEFSNLLKWQWEEEITPYWKELGAHAKDKGVKIAIEMHPGQAVYNTRTLLQLRDIAGPNLGANLDPSHLFYQGMDPPFGGPKFGQGFCVSCACERHPPGSLRNGVDRGTGYAPHGKRQRAVMGLSDVGIWSRRTLVARLHHCVARSWLRRITEH